MWVVLPVSSSMWARTHPHGAGVWELEEPVTLMGSAYWLT